MLPTRQAKSPFRQLLEDQAATGVSAFLNTGHMAAAVIELVSNAAGDMTVQLRAVDPAGTEHAVRYVELAGDGVLTVIDDDITIGNSESRRFQLAEPVDTVAVRVSAYTAGTLSAWVRGSGVAPPFPFNPAHDTSQHSGALGVREDTFRVGQYLMDPWTWSQGNQPITADFLHAIPLWVPRSMTFDRIGCRVISAGAGGALIRLGIYNDDGLGYPNARQLDAGTVAGDSTGVKLITISKQLTRGLYWLVAVASLDIVNMRYDQPSGPHPLGFTALDSNPEMWRVSFTYAALPDPFTAGGSLNSAGQLILMLALRHLSTDD